MSSPILLFFNFFLFFFINVFIHFTAWLKPPPSSSPTPTNTPQFPQFPLPFSLPWVPICSGTLSLIRTKSILSTLRSDKAAQVGERDPKMDN